MNRADVVAFVASHGRPSWTIVGEAAEVLRGERQTCTKVDAEDIAECEGHWQPWLGCHLEPAPYRCPVCSYRDIDEGHAPCGSCGYDGSWGASLQLIALREDHVRAKKEEWRRAAKQRDIERREARHARWTQAVM